MSRSISLFSPIEADEDDFRKFVAELGGTIWKDQLPGLNVTFSEGDCHVWIYGVELPGVGQTEPPSETVIARLGARPRMSITLHISHEPVAAALALRIASEFLRRWPGMAECALYTALALHDAERTVAAVLCGRAWIAVTGDVLLSKVIEGCGGLVVDHADPELVASISAELQELGKAHGREFLDVGHDQIVGVVPLGVKHGWVVRSPITDWYASLEQADQKVRDAANHLLGQAPSSMIGVVLGYNDDEGESERVAISLFRAIATERPAVIVGVFFLHLGSADVASMLANDEWMLIR